MTKLRIFLADDHAVVREGLKALVNAQRPVIYAGQGIHWAFPRAIGSSCAT